MLTIRVATVVLRVAEQDAIVADNMSAIRRRIARADSRSMGIFEFLIDMVGYAVARVILPLLSFGWVRAEPLNSSLKGFNWLGYRRDANGRIEIEQTVAGSIGFVACVLAGFAFVSLIRSAG